MKLYSGAAPGTVARARSLRRNATEAEKRLWAALRQTYPRAKFRRQSPVEGFFADFLSFRHKLVIEVDGGQHAEQQEQDARWTALIEAAGYRVLRFWNTDVLANTDGVLQTIGAALTSPLPPGEGGARRAAVGG